MYLFNVQKCALCFYLYLQGMRTSAVATHTYVCTVHAGITFNVYERVSEGKVSLLWKGVKWSGRAEIAWQHNTALTSHWWHYFPYKKAAIAHKVLCTQYTAPPANGRFNRTYPGSWRGETPFWGIFTMRAPFVLPTRPQQSSTPFRLGQL